MPFIKIKLKIKYLAKLRKIASKTDNILQNKYMSQMRTSFENELYIMCGLSHTIIL